MPKQFHYCWKWQLPASPEALWSLVSDTNRFNRDTGLPVVEEPAESLSGTRRLRMKRYGVLIEWDEEPFEWIRPRQFGVVRRYHAGPVKEMIVRAELQPAGEHSSVLTYQVTLTPRNLVGYAAIPFEVGLVSARSFEKVFRRYAEQARHATPADVGSRYQMELRDTPAKLVVGGAERLERALRTLLTRGFDDAIVGRFRELLTHGEQTTVARIQPYVLAYVWGVSRRMAVELCLQATRVGLLDLQWDLLCPFCRGAKQTSASLRDMPNTVHCGSCHIDFEANFEQSVEVTFRVNPSLRQINVFPFCVGGPQLTPHIIAQQILAPKETRKLEFQLDQGRYRIRTEDVPGAQLFDVNEGSMPVIAFAPRDVWVDAVRDVAPQCTALLTNTSDTARLFIIERIEWSDFALTAAEITSLQQFRDLFASEALRPGETINVGFMTIMFTDLRDSTRMYQEIGDASAFGRVLDHFDMLRTALEDEEGAIVKTIGDSVMAVFRRPAAALRTVFRAQELLTSFPDGVHARNLKAGAHFGACIGVTLNDRLDYFGSTVNIAARLDALSRGGDIVISNTVADDPEVQRLLADEAIQVERFEADLKGFEGRPLQLLRVARKT